MGSNITVIKYITQVSLAAFCVWFKSIIFVSSPNIYVVAHMLPIILNTDSFDIKGIIKRIKETDGYVDLLLKIIRINARRL